MKRILVFALSFCLISPLFGQTGTAGTLGTTDGSMPDTAASSTSTKTLVSTSSLTTTLVSTTSSSNTTTTSSSSSTTISTSGSTAPATGRPIYDDLFMERKSLSFGFLHGGGGLIGADLEALVTPTVGLSGGLGLLSYGAGLHVHFRPGIHSSSISLCYWHQGFGDSFTQALVGPSLIFRAKRFLTAQVGLGMVVARGPALPEEYKEVPLVLTYAIGIYLPM